MKKIFFLSLIFLLNGCAESLALLGTSPSNGKIIQSSAINNLKFYYASGNVAQGKFSLYGIRA